MKSRIAVLLLLAAGSWAGVVWAQQAEMAASEPKPAAKAVAAKPTTPAKVDPVRKKQAEPLRRVDGDAAYKANCSRCHAAPRKFSERQMATIMQHMRVRANMTEDETEAILKYLTR